MSAHAGLEAKLFYQGDESAIRETIGDRTFIRAKVHADCTPGRLLVAAAAERDDIGRVMAAGPEALAVLSRLAERAQKVADNFPGKEMERLLSTVSAIEVPVDIIREALDVLWKAGCGDDA